ncbi:hypothetical protein HRI_002702200 [Hibiscus trionum]|uniref:DUF4005 domain-containing protein n=1 Tax=Hibiscus trionum TaxID=183268 RepID=A0A9W7I4M1_HIBTR|nr:hypothetical protein HRI_002702200 [Hibiscus trionum]
MGKKRDWLCVVKKAFSPDTKKNKETSKPKKKWLGNSKNSGPAASLPEREPEKPKPTPTEPANLTEAQNEHKKHAYSVALATAMAAAAAVVDAREAADGVHVPSSPEKTATEAVHATSAQGNSLGKDVVEAVHTASVEGESSEKITAAGAVHAASVLGESSEKTSADESVHVASLQRKSSQKTATEAVYAASVQGESLEKKAAIKIQTAFRGYSAKKEVGGLRRLKSYIQGQSMKQATTTLRCMQTLGRVQSQIRARRLRMSEENRMLQKKRDKELEEKNASLGLDWRGSKKSKEQSEAIKQNRQQAAKKRERALAYAFTHQRSWKVPSKAVTQTLMDQQNPLWGWSWFERWMAARPWEMSTSTPNNAALSISNNQNNNNNKSSPTPSKPSSRPTARPSLLTPRSKIPSISSKIRQPSSSVTRCGGDQDPTLDRQRRGQSTVGGFQSVRDDESRGISAAVAPNSRKTTAPAQITNTRQSRPVTSSGLGLTPQMGLASTAKKRLSFPQKTSSNMKQSGPPVADNNTALKYTAKKEGKLRNGGVVGSGGGKVV